MWEQVAISGMKQSASWVFKRKSNKGVKTLNLFYDQYGGSNNNIMVFLMLSCMVNKHEIDLVPLIYLVSGL